jgi:GT2 family glycosyltransferase
MRSAGVDLTLIIVNWNSSDMLAACLDSIEKWIKDLTFEAIIVDNCSGEEDVQKLKGKLEPRFSWARFMYNNENVGFAGANNQALKLAKGKYILLLNPDTCLVEDGLSKLIPKLKEKEIGMVSCKLLNADMSIQESCFYFPKPGRIFFTSLLLHKVLPERLRNKLTYSKQDHQHPQSPDWVLGAFMLLPRAIMLKLGGFDESIFMYGEDMDICYRLRKLGLQILYVSDIAIIHYGGHSGNQAWSSAKREVMVYQAIFYFYRKHYGRGKLALAKLLYSLGALLRMLGYGIGSLKPGNFCHNINEVKTQWQVLLTQLSFK